MCDASELAPTLITKEELRSDHWLLAYEAPKKGWLGTTAHFQGRPEFDALADWDVEFYDSDSRLDSVPDVFEPLPARTAPDEPMEQEEAVRRPRSRAMDLFDVTLTVETDGNGDEPYP